MTQRDARRSIRNLVQALRSNPADKWQEVIAFALASEPAIYTYTKEQGIPKVLIEGGGDQDLVNRFLAHPALSLIPEDVPRA